MNKQLFEQDIENKIIEELYIKDNTKIIYKSGCYGCIKNKGLYALYYITEEELCLVLSIFNNESDAYEYLKEIMDYIHNIKINIILDEYFNNHLYKDKIKEYIYTDFLFANEFHKRIEDSSKIRKKGSKNERNSRKINREK